MALITFDTQRAFKIPDDKRDEYFAIVDKASPAFREHINRAVDATNDPIVIFDLEYIPATAWMYIAFHLGQIGATEITSTLT